EENPNVPRTPPEMAAPGNQEQRVKAQDMSAEPKPDLQLEIAHVLLIDVVGYSKLLVNEQIEFLQELNQIVRSTESFRPAEKKVNWFGCRLEAGWRSFSSTVRKSRCDVRSRSAEHCKSIRISNYGWECTAAQSIKSPMLMTRRPSRDQGSTGGSALWIVAVVGNFFC